MNAAATAPIWQLDRRSGRLLAAVALTALLHLVLLQGLLEPAARTIRRGGATPEPSRITILRMIRPPAAAPALLRPAGEEVTLLPRATPPPPAPERRANRPATRPAASEEAPATSTSSPGSTPPVAEPAPAADNASARPATAASDLLDGDATRRAIRASARQPSLTTAAAAASDEPAASAVAARLGSAIAGAAHGDCLKGEYAGAGMGLLSVPFLAAAVANGKCTK